MHNLGIPSLDNHNWIKPLYLSSKNDNVNAVVNNLSNLLITNSFIEPITFDYIKGRVSIKKVQI